jgi:hypothetical protein
MLRAPRLIAALLIIALSPAALAQTSSGHMDLDDMNTAVGQRLAIARVMISKTETVCPQQSGMIRIDAQGGVRDVVVALALPGSPDWMLETSADADDFSFRRRLATGTCRIDIEATV